MKKSLLVMGVSLVLVSPVLAKDNEREMEKNEARPTWSATPRPTRTEAETEKMRVIIEMKQKLAGMKDEKKKALAVDLVGKMCELNTRRTSTMSSALTRISAVVAKVKAKVSSLPAEKQSSVNVAVSNAEAAIATAKSAVVVQAGMTCPTPTSTDSASLRNEINSARQDLETKLKAVNQKVNDARKAAMEAVKAYAAASGEKI